MQQSCDGIVTLSYYAYNYRTDFYVSNTKNILTNILIAPDKFKGSLTAGQVCEAISMGITRFNDSFNIDLVPLADGGEGTLSVLSSSMPLQNVAVEVCDPLFRPVTANYLIGQDVAYIEMSAASGLELLSPSERNCLYTTTYGTGQLIKDALQRGVKELYLFVGGSATNDAGIGMANALGYSFVDTNNKPLRPIGENLAKIEDFHLEDAKVDWRHIAFHVVCDVENGLFGPEGAAWVYAAQKGADVQSIELLDHGLKNFGNLVRQKLDKDIATKKGSGAAGGLGAGAMAFLDATVKSGIHTVMDIVGLERYMKNADLVITGEGKFDRQTMAGKVVAGVGALARKYEIPVGVLCGAKDDDISDNDLRHLGVSKLLTIKDKDMDLDFAINNAYDLLMDRSTEIVRSFYNS